MTNPFALIALHAAEAYAKAASISHTQQHTTTIPKTLLYALGTTILATVLYKSATKPYNILHTLSLPFKYFYYSLQNKRQQIKTLSFEEKYVKEYDEWQNRPTRQSPTLDEKERLENMYYSTVRETINDFYGDVIMCYDHATLSFAYYARTGNIPYKYLETISRKYMIETDAPREIHVDIREEVKKAINKQATTTSTSTSTSTSSQEPSQEDDTPFVKLKSYNTASNLNLHTTTHETKERTHKFATPDTTKQETSSSYASTASSGTTTVIRENANRYSYRGKLIEFDEHHKTFLADRRKATATAAATATATTAATATATSNASPTTSSYAEYKKQMLQRSAL